MHRHARLEGFAESRPARATRRLRRARRLNPKPIYGGHQDSVDRGSDLASYQESVWAILPDTISLEFGFAHGREFVVD